MTRKVSRTRAPYARARPSPRTTSNMEVGGEVTAYFSIVTVSIVFDPRDRAAGARSLAARPLPLRAVGFTVSSPASTVVEFPKRNFAFFSARRCQNLFAPRWVLQ